MMLIDSHCHLDLEQFDPDRQAVVERAEAAGVRAIVNPGIDLAHSRAAIALSEAFDAVYAAVGIHPNSSAGIGPEELAELRALSAHTRVVALGEIGLDYYWQLVEPAVQRTVFEAQLELAAELGLPVIIHCREANDDVAAVLRSWVAGESFRRSPLARRPFAGVLHAFPGDLALAREAWEWNFVVGLGGPVTFRNARALHELAPQLRLDRLMLETDAPYLTPHPHRGKRNEPAWVELVCRQIAALTGLTPEAVAEATTAVAVRFFGLEEVFRAQSPDSDADGRPVGRAAAY